MIRHGITRAVSYCDLLLSDCFHKVHAIWCQQKAPEASLQDVCLCLSYVFTFYELNMSMGQRKDTSFCSCFLLAIDFSWRHPCLGPIALKPSISSIAQVCPGLLCMFATGWQPGIAVWLLRVHMTKFANEGFSGANDVLARLKTHQNALKFHPKPLMNPVGSRANALAWSCVFSCGASPEA